MTRATIRTYREASRLNSAHAALIKDCLDTIDHLQSFTRRGASPKSLPDKANVELPLAATTNPKKRARGTVQELQAFAKEQQMPASDGEFLFHHFEGRGWKDVLDWKAHFRKWKTANWFPSQKQTASNARLVRTGPAGCTL